MMAQQSGFSSGTVYAVYAVCFIFIQHSVFSVFAGGVAGCIIVAIWIKYEYGFVIVFTTRCVDYIKSAKRLFHYFRGIT